MRSAWKLAPNSDHPKYKVVALLVKGGRLIAHSWNRHKPGYRFLRRHQGVRQGRHAEHSIFYMRDVPSGATLYILNITRAGNVGTARPCSSCMELLRKYKVVKIVFSSPDGTKSEDISYS